MIKSKNLPKQYTQNYFKKMSIYSKLTLRIYLQSESYYHSGSQRDTIIKKINNIY